MEAWHIWIIIALVMVITEIFTSGFAVLCLSLGALAGGIAAALGCDIKVQILWFAAISLLSFVTIRPVLLKYLHRKKHRIATNAEALIGKTAVVSETIDPVRGTGRVKIDGDDWKAVSEKDTVITTGEKVIVTNINSIILTVKKIN